MDGAEIKIRVSHMQEQVGNFRGRHQEHLVVKSLEDFEFQRSDCLKLIRQLTQAYNRTTVSFACHLKTDES